MRSGLFFYMCATFIGVFFFSVVNTVPTLSKNSSANSSSFLVKKTSKKTKRLSKNRLKENIGVELKSALYKCVSISHKLGCVQQKLALLQNKLISRVESLVGNERPFKRAGRADLTKAFEIMDNVSKKLCSQEFEIAQLISRMQTNNCLKVVEGVKT